MLCPDIVKRVLKTPFLASLEPLLQVNSVGKFTALPVSVSKLLLYTPRRRGHATPLHIDGKVSWLWILSEVKLVLRITHFLKCYSFICGSQWLLLLQEISVAVQRS